MDRLARPYDLAVRLRGGEVVLTAWSTAFTAPGVMAELAAAGYPAITFDMQHGVHNIATLADAIPRVVAHGTAPIVRVPVGDFASASRAVDYGATAVIAPMIDSAEDARRFVSHVKYLPLGQRSWGPAASMRLAGVSDPGVWLAGANDATLAFAMIESRPALDALDDILRVPGLDGVFIGPADLSIALTNGARFAPSAEETQETAARVAAKAVAAGKLAGAFAVSTADAKRAAAAGFRLIALGVDFALLHEAARATLASFASDGTAAKGGRGGY